MKNKLTDLNDHLFAQLERLNDEDLDGEALAQEIQRSSAVTAVAREITEGASLQLKAAELKAKHLGLHHGDIPKQLGVAPDALPSS